MSTITDITGHITATTGVGSPITLGAAIDDTKVGKLRSFADAGIADGQLVHYVLYDRGTHHRETCRGVYTATGTTLTRETLASTNSNNPISLSGNAEVLVTSLAKDLPGVRPMFGHAMYSPNIYPVWESGRRDISSSLSVYGETTDSGHTFAAVTLDPAVTGICSWSPNGYISCNGSPGGNHGVDSPLTLIDDWTTARPSIGISIKNTDTAHWSRNLILNYIDSDNFLYISLGLYGLSLVSVVSGVVTNLGSPFQGGTTSPSLAINSMGIIDIVVNWVTVHSGASDISSGIEMSLNGRYNKNPLVLPSGCQIFKDTPGKVGWGIGRGSLIYGFFAGERL